MIGAGSIILEFVLTMIAVLMWDKQHYTAITLGAMDYMYSSLSAVFRCS